MPLGSHHHHHPAKTVPESREERQWLCIMAVFAPRIPMYQIIRILQLTFHEPFDPIRTRALYEKMESRMDRDYCEVIERGIDDEYNQEVLRQVEVVRRYVADSEKLEH